MGRNAQRLTRRQTLDFDAVPHNDWSTPQALPYFGHGGKFSYSILRGPATSTVTEVTLLIYQGSAYTTATDPATVPDDDKVFERTGITVAGHATDADDEYNILLDRAGAVYDTYQVVKDQRQEQNFQVQQSTVEDVGLWCAILGTAGSEADDDFAWTLVAVDVV